MSPAPSHILIVGAGVFGLSTALAFLRRPEYTSSKITILDASAQLPNPSGSSVDASRIVRADYADAAYARLSLEAQTHWRDISDAGLGGQGRYHEPGFVLTANIGAAEYVKKSFQNLKSLAESGLYDLDPSKIEELPDKDTIKKATGHTGVSGDSGYVNWSSGWADAEACVRYVFERLQKEASDRVEIRSNSAVRRLLVDSSQRCTGVELSNKTTLHADLTILATGAWTPSLIDLRGRAMATGQVIGYIPISAAEQEYLGPKPTVMNLSTGMFIIPPRKQELKIACHGYGYRHMKKLRLAGDLATGEEVTGEEGEGNGHKDDDDEIMEVSVPKPGEPIPAEGAQACRAALREMLPEVSEREFARTRVCWYCDTPDGNFLIDAHPTHGGLFIATGGSGHGFKFLPVIGDKIVDAVEGRLEPELRRLWAWREMPVRAFHGTEDGSRSGRRGLLLAESASS